MWIFHPLGFASIVADRQNPANLLARGRVRGDLERLFPGCRVTVSPERDYRFRASVPREAVADRLAELAEVIDYDNFKDACPDDRHLPYLRVWSVMNSLQQDRAPVARRPAVISKKAKRRRKRVGLLPENVKTDADYYEWLTAQPRTYSDPDREEAETFLQEL